MSLPKPEDLVRDVAFIERELLLLESQFGAQPIAVGSPDSKVLVVANADINLQSVTIDQAELDAIAAELDEGKRARLVALLKSKVLTTCALALGQANGFSSPAAAAKASTYTLTGLPDASFPPPRDFGFDSAVGNGIAAARGILALIGAQIHEGQQGSVRAKVHGSLELCGLEFVPPLPASADVLGTSTVGAINEALRRAKNVFEDSIRSPVEDVLAQKPRPRLADPRPRVLLVVESAASLRPSDEALRTRLVALGFGVDVRKAPESSSADANGRALVVISESITAADVGTKFTSAPVPIIACEPATLRDLKMTGATQGTDFASFTGQKDLQITAGHPLAAGRSGRILVTTAASTFTAGAPSAAARKVATIVGKANAWAIFAYDTGDTMVGLDAPARRIGWFAGADAPSRFTEDGWRLFDAAVRWATASKALLTVKAQPLAPGDAAIKQRLEENHGFEVVVRLEGDKKVSDLKDMRVHVISESVTASAVASRFTSSPAPTIVCDANLFDDMKLTGTVTDVDFGELNAQTELDIQPSTPFAGCSTGNVAVVSSPQRFAWGKPGSEALKVAAMAGRTDRWGVFAYEGGAQMVGARAPAPRVGFFASTPAFAVLTPAGAGLFDAAVGWARRRRVLLIVGSTSQLGPADEAIRARLEESFGFLVDVRPAKTVLDAHANGKVVIVISESVTASDIGSRFTSVAVPLVSLEPQLYDDLKMTGTQSGVDFGSADGQTELEVVLPDHPLAGGLPAMRVKVTDASSTFGFGKPSNAAVRVARIVGRTDAWAVFGYDTGATMVGGTAPARRVGCFVARSTPLALNESGLRLFDAAILWAAGSVEVLPRPGSVPDAIRVVPIDRGSSGARSPWQVGVAYQVGDEVVFNGLAYRCRQAHTSQSDWEPPVTFALWERIDAGNVWAPQVIYQVGDVVTFQSHSYRAIQAHQSQIGWEPPNVQALWQRLD